MRGRGCVWTIVRCSEQTGRLLRRIGTSGSSESPRGGGSRSDGGDERSIRGRSPLGNVFFWLGGSFNIGKFCQELFLQILLLLITRCAAAQCVKVVTAPLLEQQGCTISGTSKIDIDRFASENVCNGMPLVQTTAVWSGIRIVFEYELQ